jgi:hypothetical protein
MGKKKAQDGNDHMAGVIRLEKTSRKYGDHDGPDKRRPPVTEPFHPSGPGQARGRID